MATPISFTREHITAEEFVTISKESTSRFSSIPKDIVEYLILPLIRNPYTVCEYDNSLDYLKNKKFSRAQEDIFNEDVEVLQANNFSEAGIKAFLQKYPDFKLYNTFDESSLLFIACETNLQAVENVLSFPDALVSINSVNRTLNGLQTPLLYSMDPRQATVEVCKLLLDHGANPNLAAVMCNISKEYYISKGAVTPLWLATFYKHKEITKLLIERGGFAFPTLDSNQDLFYISAKKEMRKVT